MSHIDEWRVPESLVDERRSVVPQRIEREIVNRADLVDLARERLMLCDVPDELSLEVDRAPVSEPLAILVSCAHVRSLVERL